MTITYVPINKKGEAVAKGAKPSKRLPPKVLVSLRIDQDVLDAFKATGDGYQSRMNAALRTMMPKPSTFTPVPKPKPTGKKP